MPHIIVEYTESLNLDWPKMLDELHYGLSDHDTIDLKAIKTRAIPVQYSLVGDGHDRDTFIHIVVKLLKGRDETLRKTIGQSLFDIAKKHTHDDRIAVSVEVAEMNVNTYTK